ncbi:MAG: OadG family protein [Blautia sp.]|nr:OadG family protein [Blautia sp.]
MKIFKKLTSVCTALLCALVMLICSASAVSAAGNGSDSLEKTLITTAEGLTDTIIPLEDSDIENYLNSGDDFTVTAMESWRNAKEELGEKKESAGETTVVFSSNQYTITVPVKFEKADANFIYVFDDKGTPSSLTVDVQYPMSVTLKRAGLNTLMGIGIVFVMLIFLSCIISLFRFIPNPELKKAQAAKAEKAEKEALAATGQVPAAEEEDLTDDGELVAVIAAAVAVAEGTSTDGFVVRSIRRAKRNNR